MKAFYDLTNHVLSQIDSGKVEFPFAVEHLGVKKAIIHQNVSLYFKIEHQNIYLITFFNNRMNPETLKKLLNQ